MLAYDWSHPWGPIPRDGAVLGIDTITDFGISTLTTFEALLDTLSSLVESAAGGMQKLAGAWTAVTVLEAAATLLFGTFFPNRTVGGMRLLFGVFIEFDPLAFGLQAMLFEWIDLFNSLLAGQLTFGEFLIGVLQAGRTMIVSVAQYVWGIITGIATNAGLWGPVAVLAAVVMVLLAVSLALGLAAALFRWLADVLGVRRESEEDAEDDADGSDLGWTGDIPIGLDAYTTGTGLPPWAHRIAILSFVVFSAYSAHYHLRW